MARPLDLWRPGEPGFLDRDRLWLARPRTRQICGERRVRYGLPRGFPLRAILHAYPERPSAKLPARDRGRARDSRYLPFVGASGMITALTLLPLVGGLFILGLCRTRDSARLSAVLFAFVSLVLAVLLWFGLNPDSPGMQFQEWHTWAPSLGIAYHVGVDGLGVLMLVLSALVVSMSL